MNEIELQTDRALNVLKDFQCRTVDYVFKRLWKDDRPAHRFLIADEVGLGKTLVARGIIAKTLEHLQDRVGRLDVIYVCSNATIAQQNIRRLNVTDLPQVTLPTRLTLLPAQVRDLDAHRVNFISLTPGTSLDTTKSHGGIIDERLVLWCMLKRLPKLDRGGLYNLLQCTVGDDSYKWHMQRLPTVDDALTREFLATLQRNRALYDCLSNTCHRFRERPGTGWSAEDSARRYCVIGDLRNMLAGVCVDALEPDLIILDEFQRFRDLLDGEGPAAELTERLLKFKYKQEAPEAGLRARVLLLSATPYHMLTLFDEDGDDHFEDFLRTCSFLSENDEETMQGLRADLSRYRRALLEANLRSLDIDEARRSLEARLLQLMVRTERVRASANRDAMLVQASSDLSVQVDDLRQAELIDRVASIVEARDPIEYWKSAPYLLNLMRRYRLKERFEERCKEPSADLVAAVRAGREMLLHPEAIQRYKPIPPANPRLRKLLEDTVEEGQWKQLWMPPSLPYLEPAGPFAGSAKSTKSLVFSSWVVVPDAIAAMCSYEATRLMMSEESDLPSYSELHRSRARPLAFRLRGGKPSAMNNLLLLYPSPTLAELGDPLRLALEGGANRITSNVAVNEVEAQIRQRLAEAGIEFEVGDRRQRDQRWYRAAPALLDRWRRDQRWYWAAPALLDQKYHPETTRWVKDRWGRRANTPDDGAGDGGFAQHVVEFANAMKGQLRLGPAPEDLVRVLALVALAGPAVCAYRALRRITDLDLANWHLLQGAADVAQGLRTVFNMPESIGLVRAQLPDSSKRYWESVLRYALAGNLQAVLDEYAHVLEESLGLMGHPAEDVVDGTSSEMSRALSLRTSQVRIDGIRSFVPGQSIKIEPFNIRTRFALRFGDLKSERGEAIQRADTVRKAFNSPFWPFILATTSIGQEGLDFHTYCHAVYHWNLPSNPVDLEQREGRVHRYKGHAVRKNVAERHGLAGIQHGLAVGGGSDPWKELFKRAKEGRSPESNDLVPYWIFDEGSSRVERHVPLLPFSREVVQLQHLIESLAVYRLAFGQPRQEDLIKYLRRQRDEVGDAVDLDKFQISLEPPPSAG